MKEYKNEITVQEIIQIMDDKELCKQLTNQDNGSFYHEKYTKPELLKYIDRFFQGLLYLIERDLKFQLVPLLNRVFFTFYAKEIEQHFEKIYTNKSIIQMILLYQKYPTELEEFGNFLKKMNFEYYHNELYSSYQACIKNDIVMEPQDFQILLFYTLFYKNQNLPRNVLYYIMKLLLENYSNLALDIEVMSYLLKHLVEDICQKSKRNSNVKLAILEKNKKAIWKQNTIYLNYYEISPFLKENLEMIDLVFVLLEKRNKNILMVHNKYEEVKIEKEQCIKDMIGSEKFLSAFAYLSVETEIEIGSLLSRIRYFQNISSKFYQKIIEKYEKAILRDIRTVQEEPTGKLILSIEQLMENVIYLVPDLTINKEFLKLEYHDNNKRKSMFELLTDFDREIKQAESSNIVEREQHLKLARYYEALILKYPLDTFNIVDQYIELIRFNVDNRETERLQEQIMCDYFVRQMNHQVQEQKITFEQLENILSHLNAYMTQYYQKKNRELNKLVTKNPTLWLQENQHLNRIYSYVKYINTKELYGSSHLEVTEFLSLEQLQLQNKIALKKKIWHQRIYMVVLVILILIFSLSLCFLIHIFVNYQSAAKKYDSVKNLTNIKNNEIKTPEIPITEAEYKIPEFTRDETIPQADFAKLKEQNEEVIGWIKFDEGPIDYPIVQGSNNEYYLSHLYDKSYNISGAIFADYRILNDFSSQNSILYGHNLRNENMFGSLKRYRDENYFNTYPYFWIITEEATYRYQIYAAYEFDSMVEKYEFQFNSEEAYQKYLDNIKARTLWNSNVEVTPKDTIMTLSTCTNDPNAMRFIVLAKRIAIYK